MSLPVWLDVAIGLVVVYLGASLFVTIMGEYVSQVVNLRGRELCGAVKALFKDTKLQEALKKNAALAPFFDGTDARKVPSYVDPDVVARALIGESGTVSNGKLTLPPVIPIVGVVGDDLDKAVAAVSHWVDSSLTVLSEKFKRNQRWVSMGIALIVTVAANLDTVALVKRLYTDKDARDQIVTLAVDVTSKVDKATFDACYARISLQGADVAGDPKCAPLIGLVDAVRQRSASLASLPIGWGSVTCSPSAWLYRVGGWMLTALALSLGAPFWFDLLTKFVNIRSGIPRPKVQESLATSTAK